MSNIIISDLESNLDLDRKALSDVLGGYGGGRKNRGQRRMKYSFKEHYSFTEKYQYKDFYKGGHYGHYNPCHFDHHHCCSW